MQSIQVRNVSAVTRVNLVDLQLGVVDTEIFQHSIWGSLTWLRRLLFKTPERGSRTIVYAAIEPKLEGLGGSYLSNCQVIGTNKISNDIKEGEKFFNFTCGLLKVDKFGQ
jgi:hypothetical protein